MKNDEVLAHVVVDPEAWKAHARIYAAKQWDKDKEHLDRMISEAAMAEDNPLQAKLNVRVTALQSKVATGPEGYYAEFLNAKVARHCAEAEAECTKKGYKTRAVREAEEEAARVATAEAAAAAKASEEAEKAAQFDALVKAKVAEVLKGA